VLAGNGGIHSGALAVMMRFLNANLSMCFFRDKWPEGQYFDLSRPPRGPDMEPESRVGRKCEYPHVNRSHMMHDRGPITARAPVVNAAYRHRDTRDDGESASSGNGLMPLMRMSQRGSARHCGGGSGAAASSYASNPQSVSESDLGHPSRQNGRRVTSYSRHGSTPHPRAT
jgi:hypothetical protein